MAEFEAALHLAAPTSGAGWGSAHYAIEVLKQAWRNVPGIEPKKDGTFFEEALIAADPRSEREYAKTFFPGEMWEKFKAGFADDAGLDPSLFRPDQDLWIVREWSNLESCIRNIGTGAADEVMDMALQQETEVPDQDLPADWEMVEEVVKHLSYKAMRTIGESLTQEEPTNIQRWAQQHGNQQVDFTDPQQLADLLTMLARYSPECSVWKNIRQAYREGKEAQYRDDRVYDLQNELDETMYERNDEAYTELRFGADFKDGFGGDWNIGPVYEVLGRQGAMRMMSDDIHKDISDGQLEVWVDQYYESDRGDDRDLSAYELVDKWYTQGRTREEDPNQMKMQFKSHLLKKKALVEMHDTPTMLPPRDDIKRHLDEQEQDIITDDVMDGVAPTTLKPRVDQIDPRLNPDGITASKTADDMDQEQAVRDEYFLEEVQDAKNEAKRRFMEEDYLQQEAAERVPPVTMGQLWAEMGDEYTAEFYGYPYKRVPDHTDAGRRKAPTPMCRARRAARRITTGRVAPSAAARSQKHPAERAQCARAPTSGT